MARLGCLLMVLLVCACASSPPEPRTPLAWSATALRAEAYYNQGQLLDALPLYQYLAAKEPKNALYAERLAFCLLAKFETTPTGPARNALIAQARAEAERAKKLGDNSNFLQTILDRIHNPAAATNNYDDALQAAEALFVKGDMDGALAAYKQIAASDPKSYQAHLFAGDVYFRKRDFKQAGEWFQKAIAIAPNYETAYRYWGDALTQAGDADAALQKFIDAVVAEPYNPKPWAGLSQWTQRNGAMLVAPKIALPKTPTSQDGKTINIDASMLNNPADGAAWLVYSTTRSMWRTDQFKKQFPSEKQYRHSLAEESTAIQSALLVIDEKESKDATLRTLAELQKDGMLEAYLLLSAPDEGITKDYDAYRNAHRQTLNDYMVKYVVKRANVSPQPAAH